MVAVCDWEHINVIPCAITSFVILYMYVYMRIDGGLCTCSYFVRLDYSPRFVYAQTGF